MQNLTAVILAHAEVEKSTFQTKPAQLVQHTSSRVRPNISATTTADAYVRLKVSDTSTTLEDHRLGGRNDDARKNKGRPVRSLLLLPPSIHANWRLYTCQT